MPKTKITREQVAELERLYREREELERCIGLGGNKNFWIGFVETATNVHTERSDVRDALGGLGDTASLFMVAAGERFAALRQTLDEQIEKLGGQP